MSGRHYTRKGKNFNELIIQKQPIEVFCKLSVLIAAGKLKLDMMPVGY